MTILNPVVSQYTLTVDAVDTVEVMVDSADNPWGRRLYDALTYAVREPSVVYVVAPYARTDPSDFRPGVASEAGILRVDGRSAAEVLRKLAAVGYVSLGDVVREGASGSYLSDDRIVTSVRVLRAFVLVGVDYSWSSDAERRLSEYGYADADRWSVDGRTYTVPVGCYLVAEVGDYHRMDLAGVAAMDSDCVDWLFELEGFEATECRAWCAACDTSWRASDGSWHFQPDDTSDGQPWAFDNALDFDETTNTIGCPGCGSGRVHFDIY